MNKKYLHKKIIKFPNIIKLCLLHHNKNKTYSNNKLIIANINLNKKLKKMAIIKNKIKIKNKHIYHKNYNFKTQVYCKRKVEQNVFIINMKINK